MEHELRSSLRRRVQSASNMVLISLSERLKLSGWRMVYRAGEFAWTHRSDRCRASLFASEVIA
jgi:hypothetical protein